MITPKDLAPYFTRNTDTMRKFLDGLSHEDTLIQPSHNGNCLNWILGHLVNSRNSIVRMSSAPERQWQKYATWEQLRARYGNGSQPIKADGSDVLNLSQLLEGLTYSNDQVTELLNSMSSESANTEIEALGRKMTRDHFVLYMFGHEQYHIGQFEFTRPLSGRKNP